MQADLRALPNRDIWYRAAQSKWYPGRLADLFKGGEATIVLESSEWGVPWQLGEVPYGKNKVKCWYFHSPNQEARKLMETLGVPMTEEDMVPAWQVSLPAAKEAPEKPLVTPEFAEAVIENTLEDLRNHDNGIDSAAVDRPDDMGRRKAKATASSKHR
jgi:hypothetical protein